MPDNKIITLENLTEFKAKCDQAYSGGGGSGQYLHKITVVALGDYGMANKAKIILLTDSSEEINTIQKLHAHWIANEGQTVGGTNNGRVPTTYLQTIWEIYGVQNIIDTSIYNVLSFSDFLLRGSYSYSGDYYFAFKCILQKINDGTIYYDLQPTSDHFLSSKYKITSVSDTVTEL